MRALLLFYYFLTGTAGWHNRTGIGQVDR